MNNIQYTEHLSKRELWHQWVLANAIGAGLGALPFALIGVNIASSYTSLLIFATCTAFAVSFAQAWILRSRLLPPRGETFPWRWFILSGICSLVMIGLAPIIMFALFYAASLMPIKANIAFNGEGQLVLFFLFGLMSGTITGAIQHILFPNFKKSLARQWIIFSGLGACFGLGISNLLADIIFQGSIFTFENISGENVGLNLFGLLCFNLLAGVINGGITGVQIVRIFRAR